MDFEELLYGPLPFNPRPPRGGGGKVAASGTDALNEAREAQGKPPESDDKGKAKQKLPDGHAEWKENTEEGDGGKADVIDFTEIERKLEEEKRKRRRGY